MATIKIILDLRRAKEDDTYPLKIRVYQDTKYRDISLSIFLKPEDWDDPRREIKRTHPNFKLLNHKILKQFTELEATLLREENTKTVDLNGLASKAKGGIVQFGLRCDTNTHQHYNRNKVYQWEWR